MTRNTSREQRHTTATLVKSLHEGNPRLHWSWILWLNTVALLVVGFECVVLIFMWLVNV